MQKWATLDPFPPLAKVTVVTPVTDTDSYSVQRLKE